MAHTSPRAPLSPLKTPPPIRGPINPCSPAPRHLRTPSEPSPLRNVSFSAADLSSPEEVLAHNLTILNKLPLQCRSLNRTGKHPVDPSEIATLLGLKPSSLRTVSGASDSSDKTVRCNSNGSSDGSSPSNDVGSSPRTRPLHRPQCIPRHNSIDITLSSSPSGTRSGSRNGSPRNSPASEDKENAQRAASPRSFSRGHMRHKRKISSVQSPQINQRQAARRTGSGSWSTLPHAPSVSTPGGTFGAYPAYPFASSPSWLHDPAVLDILSQLAEEAQDPPSPTTSVASSVWAAILKPHVSPEISAAVGFPRDVFHSPRTGNASPVTARGGTKQTDLGLFSPSKRASGVAMESSPQRSRSPRQLKLSMGQTTPTIPEAEEEEDAQDAAGRRPKYVSPLSNRSPTKNARREATALASSALAMSLVSTSPPAKGFPAQWNLTASQLGRQAETALGASMAALTLSTVPVDPEFSRGDITLVCRGDNGYIGFKAECTKLLAFFNNFPVLSQTIGVTHIPLRESPNDVKALLRFIAGQSTDPAMSAPEVLAIHRMFNLYEATDIARLTLSVLAYQNPMALCESLGMSPNRLELLSFLRLTAELRSAEIWRTIIDLLMRGWWRSDLDPFRMSPFDVAVLGGNSYRALHFLAGDPGRVWDSLQDCSVSRDKSGNFSMTRVSLSGYCTFVDSTL